MSPTYRQLEDRILNLLSVGKTFVFNGITYEVIISAKPRAKDGEPKTDIYIKAVEIENPDQETEFKISIKKDDADFLGNKISAETASSIFGDQWQSIISNTIIKNIKQKIEQTKLIYKQKYIKTNAGSICLGWRLDIMKYRRGLSGELVLSDKQKCEVLTGENSSDDKKHSLVNSLRIKNSGIANYIIEDIVLDDLYNYTADQIAQSFKKIDNNYVHDFPMFLSLIALNYRSFQGKWDGNRPLAVAINWSVEENKLKSEIIFDRTLLVNGSEIVQNLQLALKSINVKNTDGLDINNVYN